jgi:hypothetical protein
VSVAREKAHARRVTAYEHSKAVVFDLVNPADTHRRLWRWAGQTRFNEAVWAGTQTQHGPLDITGLRIKSKKSPDMCRGFKA